MNAKLHLDALTDCRHVRLYLRCCGRKLAAYLSKLLGRPGIARWFLQNEPDYLEQFQAIAEINSLRDQSAGT